MEGIIVTVALVVLAYPFIAAAMVGARHTRRLDQLEHELETLRQALQVTPRAAADLPGWKPDVPDVPDVSDLPDASERAASPPAAGARRPMDDSQPIDEDDYGEVWIGPSHLPDTAPQPQLRKEDAAPLAGAALDSSIGQSADGVADLPEWAFLGKEAGAAQDGPDEASPIGPEAKAPPPSDPPSQPPRWLVAAKGWLLTGNLVAKIGLVILFIGVGFLLKYAAETYTVPIELRLAAVVLADLGLLAWGWRLRTVRRDIGLPMQGTAIAILMLVIFGAYQRYDLVPAGFAFAILVTLTAFTCLLAVLQNAIWLAAFGITGGFACPLLLSTGEGNHVGLFSYYALLNAGVFVLATRKAWRLLNLLGFAFTFIVGAAWGGLRYTPADYLSGQGFLILFFLLYVGIALAFARQQQTRLKEYVDATLVLGTPLLAFGLQVGLVRDKPFGLALSALAVGAFYLLLALILVRRERERWRVLAETFLGLGVVFGTLAIPFAFDGRWTSGVWALEGAAFVWFGLRRQQRLTWAFGMLLQLGAWVGFIGAASGLDPAAAARSNLWLGFLLLAGSALGMARNFRTYANESHPRLGTIANCCITIAAIWLFAGCWTEAILRTSGSTLANCLVAGAVLTAALIYLTAARLAWPKADRLAMLAQLAGAGGLVVVTFVNSSASHSGVYDSNTPLLGVMMIAIAAFATARMLERQASDQAGSRLAGAALLWASVWWFGPVIGIAAGRLADYLPESLGSSAARWMVLAAFGAVVSSIICARLAARLQWARLRWLSAFSWAMMVLVTAETVRALYGARVLPDAAVWLAWGLLLAGSEYILVLWQANTQPLKRTVVQTVHAVRTAGPWMALWPVGAILLDGWLAAPGGADLAVQGDWATSAAWGNYLPTWAMMLALAWLVRRSLAEKWPTAPLAHWYRAAVIPCGSLLVLALAVLWNLGQDGTMAPLPYLPLLNPLDLTTGFALMLWVGAAGPLAARSSDPDQLLRGLRIATAALAYGWFNLILLRSAAQYLGIGYWWEDLAASQFVQSMLSLVWSASALVLMRFAARREMRRSWALGALLLCVVLLKLFTVDLANSGSIARVVSFVGVGMLTLLVGYLAPYPKAGEAHAAAASAA